MCEKIVNAYEQFQHNVTLNRRTLQNIDGKLFPDNHPTPTSLIEITGSNSSGKTHVLHYLIALSVIPEDFGGKQGRAILVDLKNKFDPEVFLRQSINLIKGGIEAGGCTSTFMVSELNDERIEQIALNCLKAITIMYCYSAEELFFAMHCIQNMLMDEKNSDIILFALDGLETFYWIENFERKLRMRTHYAQLVERLRDISNLSNITCIYTVGKEYSDFKFHYEPELYDYRLVLNRQPGAVERTLNGLRIDIDKNGIKFL